MDQNIIESYLRKIRLYSTDKTLFLELSRFFRLNEMNEASFYFGKKYLKYHPHDLHIHNELSIVSYYVDEIEQGYKSCEEILLSLDTAFPKDFTYFNLFFYIKPISILKQNKITFPFQKNEKEEDKNRKPMNSSIVKTNNGFIIIVRTVNYKYNQNGEKIIFGQKAISENYILKISPLYKILNTKFKKINDKKLFEHIINPNSLWKGLEDVRIFLYKDEYWFTCVSLETHLKRYTQVCLGRLSHDLKNFESLIPLIGPDDNRNQKNWLPFVIDNNIILIYSHSPFILLKPILNGENKGKCEILKEKKINYDLSHFRGSFSPITYKNGYLYMIHQAICKDNFYRYISRFVYWDLSMDMIILSKEFYFFHIGVEYCAGATWNEEGNLVATVSKMDNESWICEIERKEIDKKFKEYYLTI